jgi:hypothetical protein
MEARRLDMKTEDINLLAKFLVEKGVGLPTCPVCSNKNWEAHGPVASLAQIPDGTAQYTSYPEVFPVAVLICQNCAYTLQFAWMKILRVVGDGK